VIKENPCTVIILSRTCLTEFVLGSNLVPKETPLLITGLQLLLINVWAYWGHRILHMLPEFFYNYHIYVHHNKKLHLERYIELFYEFHTNMLLFIIPLVLQRITNIYIIPEILILFVGLWYSTVHVLNLSLIPNIEHSTHHVDPKYNFGPSYMDFIFGTLKVEEGYSSDSQVINGVVLYIIIDVIRRVNKDIFQFLK
jgi:hypothetical protein